MCIPPRQRKEILLRAHDLAGHYSAKYTLANIATSFTWPGLAQDVKNYTDSCITCSRANPARPHTKAPLLPLTPAAKSMGDRIHINLVDMPRSSEGHIAICTLVDAATGFTIANPVKTKSSHPSSTLLEKFLSYTPLRKVSLTTNRATNLPITRETSKEEGT